MSPFKLLLWYFESALWYVLLRNMHVFVLTWQKRKEICLNFLILYLALRWKSFKEFLYLTIVLRHTIQLIYFRNYESQIKCLGIVAPLLMSLSFFFPIYHLSSILLTLKILLPPSLKCTLVYLISIKPVFMSLFFITGCFEVPSLPPPTLSSFLICYLFYSPIENMFICPFEALYSISLLEILSNISFCSF